jgi:hypothetical protein
MALLVAGCPSRGAPEARARVVGSVIGAPVHVVLWNAGRDLRLVHDVAPDGSYSFDEIPVGALDEGHVTVEGKDGSSTTSGKLGGVPVVLPLRVWHAPLEARREGDKVRFAWPALEGKEIPTALRYSLLFSYAGADHGALEGSVVIKGEEPALVQTLDELADLLAGRDPAATEVLVQIRAYGAETPQGPLWAGEPLHWTLPAGFPPARPLPPARER